MQGAYKEFGDIELGDLLESSTYLERWNDWLYAAEGLIPFMMFIVWLDPFDAELSGGLGVIATFALAVLPPFLMLNFATPHSDAYEANKNNLLGKAAIRIADWLAPLSLRRPFIRRLLKQRESHFRWLISLAANPAVEEALFRAFDTPMVNRPVAKLLLEQHRAGTLVEFLTAPDNSGLSELFDLNRKMEAFGATFYLGMLDVIKEERDAEAKRLFDEDLKSVDQEIKRLRESIGESSEAIQSRLKLLEQARENILSTPVEHYRDSV